MVVKHSERVSCICARFVMDFRPEIACCVGRTASGGRGTEQHVARTATRLSLTAVPAAHTVSERSRALLLTPEMLARSVSRRYPVRRTVR
jgi:hypothetical protein